MRVVLASSSPARRALLTAAGIPHEVLPSTLDEDAAIAAIEAVRGPLAHDTFVTELAEAKARSVTSRVGGHALVIGGDSMFVLDGTIYGKPHTPDRARERWLSQRGRTGTLHSGQSVLEVHNGHITALHTAHASATVTFRDDLSETEIDAYIATGEPLEVAGAFTIDSLGAAFIERIDGAPSTVIGMSIPLLREQFRALGHEWQTFWRASPAT